MTTLQITNGINYFTYDYAMIDDWNECSYNQSMEYKLEAIIPTLTPDQALEVYNGLRDFHKGQKFGQMLFAMLPAPAPEAAAPVAVKSAMKISIFTTAWSMFKAGLFTSFAESLKAAWSRTKVITGMKTGTVKFRYIKSDGSIRIATGTLSDINYVAKTTESKPKPEVVKYFDIEAQSFRSFRIDRFIGLVA